MQKRRCAETTIPGTENVLGHECKSRLTATRTLLPQCAVVEEFCQIERWRQTEFCQPYTTVEEQAVADCGCAEVHATPHCCRLLLCCVRKCIFDSLLIHLLHLVDL
eukprot:SAG31_NODE_2538_length_5543_cov_13.884093_8_plen_106_part_00